MNFKFQIIQDMHKRRGDDHAKNILMTLGMAVAVPFVLKNTRPYIQIGFYIYVISWLCI